MKEQRKIVPPVYMLFALLAMIGLHYAIPLAQVVESPLADLGLVPLVIGITIAATAARIFDRAGTPIRPFERSTTLATVDLRRAVSRLQKPRAALDLAGNSHAF